MATDFKKLVLANRGSILAALVALFVIVFYVTRNPLFAGLGFVAIILLFVNDALPSKWDAAGVKRAAIELAVALAIALAFWFALQFALGSPSPIDVVTSCSMLPNLERGDMILVRGGAINVPTVAVSGSIEAALHGATVEKDACTLSMAGKPSQQLCTTAVILNGQRVPANRTNDIIVFEPTPRYYGLIVHRAFLRVTNETSEYFLTKGDNNLGADQEGAFSAVPRSDVHGAVAFRIPLLGFLKLFMFGQFAEPPACKALVAAGN